MLGGVLTEGGFYLLATVGKDLDSVINPTWNGNLLLRLVEALNRNSVYITFALAFFAKGECLLAQKSMNQKS